MNKETLGIFFGAAKSKLTEHAPEVLVGAGTIGMIATTIMAVKATPKALMIIEEEKRKINRKLLEEAIKDGNKECNRITYLPKTEIVKSCWKVYAPAVIAGVASTACIFAGTRCGYRRNAVLGAALEVTETAAKAYQQKVIETVGEEKHAEIQEAVAKDIATTKYASSTDIYNKDHGDTLCIDKLSGRTFYANVEDIRAAQNDINQRIIDEVYINVNEFYNIIDLPETDAGERLGWEVGRCTMKIDFSSCLTADNKPCLVISYETVPTSRY